MKKTIICTLFAILLSLPAYCQDPTTLSDNNLKGKVLCVKLTTYEYSENFGEPTTGKIKTHPVITFFDEEGRSVVVRKFSRWSADEVGVETYLFGNTRDESTLTIKRQGIGFQCKYDNSLESALLVADDSFENKALELSGGSYVNKQSILENIYDANNALITSTLTDYREKIVGKYVAKPVEPGKYAWTYYLPSGESSDQGNAEYKDGRIVKMSAKSDGVVNKPKKLTIPLSGSYTYDSDGRLTNLAQQKEEIKYQLNSHGDVEKTMKLIYGKWIDDASFSDYVYDSQGNWISRVAISASGRKTIEKREIKYTSDIDLSLTMPMFRSGIKKILASYE